MGDTEIFDGGISDVINDDPARRCSCAKHLNGKDICVSGDQECNRLLLPKDALVQQGKDY